MAFSPRAVLVGLLSLGISILRVGAESAEAPPGATMDLDKIASHLSREYEDLRKSAESLRALVESELKAKRLDANAGGNFLWALDANLSTGFFDMRALTTARVTMETPNEAVSKAAQKLVELGNKVQSDRIDLNRKSLEAACQRAAEVGRTAQKPADIERTLASLEAVKGLLEERVAGGMQLLLPNGDWHPPIALMHNLLAVFTARDSGDPKLLGNALNQLQPPGYGQLSWTKVDSEKRIKEFIKPYVTAAEQAQDALEKALLARPPAKELTVFLAKFEDAEKALADARPSGYPEVAPANPIETYRTIVGLARATEESDSDYLRQNLTNVRTRLAALGAERASRLDPLFEEWRKQFAVAEKQPGKEQRGEWSDRIAAVKSPEELQALADEIERAEQAAAHNPGYAPQGQLSAQLKTLAGVWSSGNPEILAANRFDYGPPGGVYGKEINHLRERIERDLLSHSLHAPELLKPPLADEPLGVALEGLAKSISEAHEWRHLLAVFESQTNQQMPVTARTIEAITAVRSFLAGQNFELAEQWPDAIAAYKAVLSTTSELGPIKEAAERLKLLTREHPATPVPQDKSSGR
jgi:hypothetical protein